MLMPHITNRYSITLFIYNTRRTRKMKPGNFIIGVLLTFFMVTVVSTDVLAEVVNLGANSNGKIKLVKLIDDMTDEVSYKIIMIEEEKR
jgi:hypothetical protein